MFRRWLFEKLRQREIRRLLRQMTPEDRAAMRALAEWELIQFHHGLGRFLRNGFRGNQFPWLMGFCSSAVEKSGEPMSFDALSSVAIREIWRELQGKTRAPSPN